MATDVLPPLARCLEVSARGLALTRGFVRPCVAKKIGRAWWLHDDRSFGPPQRNDEWFVPGDIDPDWVDARARKVAARRFIVCAIASTLEEKIALVDKYRSLGYRLWRTETLMARPTKNAPSFESDTDIHLVDTEEVAGRLAKAARERMILLEHLAKRPLAVRCHMATVGSEVVGWVRSISVDHLSWCASLFVEPEFRRRGFGRTLVSTAMRADWAAGLSASVLIASHTGAKLYAELGYRTMATVLVLNPPRSPKGFPPKRSP